MGARLADDGVALLPWRRSLADAGLIVAGCIVIALVVNIFHPRGLPLIASRDFEILVPCPEPGGEVIALDADDPILAAPSSYLVDARQPDEAASWRFRNALNVPFDYLDPTPPEALHELAQTIARSRAHQVVVYGDGDRPDTGEQLAREISGHGIKNVCFVRGGAPALRQAFSGENRSR